MSGSNERASEWPSNLQVYFLVILLNVQVDRGADIIVATPGRLIDFVEKGKIGLGKLKYFVLDEGEEERG